MEPNLQQTECPLPTDWAIDDQAKNLNWTARPYDQRASSPLDPTAGWHSHLALAIYMFVVVNFDALSQASDFRIFIGFVRRGCDTKLSWPWVWMHVDTQTHTHMQRYLKIFEDSSRVDSHIGNKATKDTWYIKLSILTSMAAYFK